jgi:hypothetical protein
MDRPAAVRTFLVTKGAGKQIARQPFDDGQALRHADGAAVVEGLANGDLNGIPQGASSIRP